MIEFLALFMIPVFGIFLILIRAKDADSEVRATLPYTFAALDQVSD